MFGTKHITALLLPAVLLTATTGTYAFYRGSYLIASADTSTASQAVTPNSFDGAALQPLSTTWLTSYPMLLKYSHVPVLVPSSQASLVAQGMSMSAQNAGLPNFLVLADDIGYSATYAPLDEMPPWSSQQPYVLGNRTVLSISGCVAEPGPAELWANIPAGSSLTMLPGLPVKLSNGVTGYLVYGRNLFGNGGSLTTVRWRIGQYIYDVNVPIAPGEGGRHAAISVANHMALLTLAKLQQLTQHPVTKVMWTSDTHANIYRSTEKVQFHVDLNSLPPTIPAPLVNPPEAVSPSHTSSSGKGVMRGFSYTYTKSPSVRIPVKSLTIHIVRIRGKVVPGGVVTLEGKSSVTLPPDIQMEATWNPHEGSFSIHNTPHVPDAIGTDPNTAGYQPLKNIHIKGDRFTATLAIPRALYAPQAGNTHRFANLERGLDTVSLDAWNLPRDVAFAPSAFTIQVHRGIEPWHPDHTDGPYLLSFTTPHTLPPMSAVALNFLGLDGQSESTRFGSVDSPSPVLLPAWVPSSISLLQLPPMTGGQWPLGIAQSIPGGYAAVLYKSGVNERLGPYPKSWPQNLTQTTLVTYGTMHADPLGTQVGPGNPIRLGLAYGTITTVTGGGTLVRFHANSSSYGIYAAPSISKLDVIRMARSMSEQTAGAHLVPSNVVLGYVQLLNAYKNKQPGDHGSELFPPIWSSPKLWEEPKADEAIDREFLSWRDLHVRIKSTKGRAVEAVFSGQQKQGEQWKNVSMEVRVVVTSSGQMKSWKAIQAITS